MNIFRRLYLFLTTGTRIRRTSNGTYYAQRGHSSMGVPSFRPIPRTVWGKVTVQSSLDGSLYYLPDYCDSHGFWLSVETFPADEAEAYKGVFDGMLRITKNDGTSYCRRHFPFAFWEITPGERKRVAMKEDPVLDYLCHQAELQDQAMKRFEDFCHGRE